MEENRIEIMICLGSSCFSRGNKKTVDTIKQYITEHHLENKVFFHGGHCFGGCENGPKVKIGGTIYENVDHNNVIDLLVRTFDTLV
jgi:NADH:ubiquinone oxidoreductase subunit E